MRVIAYSQLSDVRQEVDLTADILRIGRDPANDLELQSPFVSREHARLLRHDGDFFIENVGLNGTLVDDKRGAFYFHEKVDGHGQGVVTRLWDLGEGEHDLDVISSDCRSHADAFAVVDEHLEELASMCVDFLADF